MKIVEVTQSSSNLQEIGLGGLLSRGAAAIRSAVGNPAVQNFARGVGSQLMTQITGVDKPGGKDWFNKELPPDLRGPIEKISEEIAKTWPQSVLAVMNRSRDPATGAVGVVSFRKIDRRELAKETNLLISQLWNKFTGGKVSSISAIDSLKGSDAVTNSTNPTELTSQIDDVENKVNVALRLLSMTDPGDPAKANTIKTAWETVVKAAFKFNEILATPNKDQFGLAGRNIAKDSRGRITVDGRTLDPANPADARMIQAIQGQGLV